ncbi:hypothetical protein V1264_003538 [Littorina saxatilis]|uniref:NADH dehydrogenase [ubiquinone] flavoprotein 3, mitochondrial n=1 Tax=Littorina saxatilis TaxID=31220 RepID=A0AAN9GA30_9CAEN
MSARALQRAAAFLQTGRFPLVSRCCSSQAGSSGAGDGAKGDSTAAKAPKAKKASEQPKPAVFYAAKRLAAGSLYIVQGKKAQPKYMAPELFEYNPMSFYDLEVAISPARNPQPSSVRKEA